MEKFSKPLESQDEGQYCDETVGPVNNETLKQFPHYSIGALTSTMQNNPQVKINGTAFLISPNLLLTAAHNVFNRKQGRQNHNFRFYHSANGECSREKDCIRGLRARYSPKYVKLASRPQGCSQEDYALVKLQRRVDETSPYSKCLPLTPYCQQCNIKLQNQQILKIYGYPSDISSGQTQNYKVTNAPENIFILRQEGVTSINGQNRLLQINRQKQIGYKMTTIKGQSGSPMVYGNKTIAVHIKSGDRDVNSSINGEEKVLFNIGRLITLDMLKNIKEWCNQMEADPFQVDIENLCPHLRSRLVAKRGSSKHLDILDLPPREYRFDEKTLNSNDLGPSPKTDSIFLRDVSYRRRRFQVERSTTFTAAEKKQKMSELNQEYRNTIGNEWNKAAKFQDATTLVSRRTNLKEFSEHTLLPNITTLDLQNNQLSAIDLSNNKSLNFLNLNWNKLTSINLSPLTNLTVLQLYGNNIRQINLASNEHLAFIDLRSNGLESLQLPSRGSIAVLYVYRNKLKEFRFFYDPAIFSEHRFWNNPQGCSITVAYDKKNSNKAKQFEKELKNYDKGKYNNYKSYVFRLQEV